MLESKTKRFGVIVECDELWSFVTGKNNELLVWLALDKFTRQIIGVHIGQRTKENAQALFDSLPDNCKKQSYFYTDLWKSYSVFPQDRHYFPLKRR